MSGLALALLVGLLVMLLVVGTATGRGPLRWFGRLPGDVRLEFGDGVLFVPITSMLLVSVGPSVVAGLVRWLRERGRR